MQAGSLKEPIIIMEPDIKMGDLRSPEMTYHEGWRTRAAVSTPGTSRTSDKPDLGIAWNGGTYRIVGIETDRARMEMVIKTELVNERSRDNKPC